MAAYTEQLGVLGVRMETLLLASRNLKHASVGEPENAGVFMLWGTHDGNGLWQHKLIGAVSVEIHTGQECRLRGVCVNPSQREETMLILNTE